MLIVFILVGCIFTGCTTESFRISSVYCENRVDPVGVPTSGIRFSWKLSSQDRNVVQTAYRLVLANKITGSPEDEEFIWDSEKVNSNQNILVPYEGPELEPGSAYEWKVKAWDNLGNESDWSDPGKFITGLGESDWEGAEWIGFSKLDPEKRIVPGIHVPGFRKEWKNVKSGEHILPVFRKEFTAGDELASGCVFVSGMGQYELSLNGEKVGDHFMAPGWTHYDEQCMYNIYDVTDQIRPGPNCLGMMLGNGFYIIPNTRYRKLITAYGNPKMILMLRLTYEDGSTETIISNQEWKAAPGPITYSSIFGGENYNATLEKEGWDLPGFDDRRWRNALTVPSSAILIPERDYPLRVAEEIEPVSVTGKGNKYLYDFGQNASGIIRITLSGKRGDTVRLTPSELLRDNLEPDQRATGRPYYYVYVMKGEGNETWSPRFTYTGFRYVQVVGAVPDTVDSTGPRIRQLTMLHTRNSAPASGEFESSNELFAKINSLILWAIRSNLASVVTDCPHREKLGWLEQTYLMGGSIHYNYDVYHLYCKLIEDMIVAQDDDGLVPCIAPEYTEFTGGFRDTPEWGSASVILPWLIYKWYGDKSQMEKAWDMMCQYMEYLDGKAENNILSHGLGDWYDLGPEPPGLAQLTPVALTATAIYYHDLSLMAEIEALLDKAGEAEFYRSRAMEVRTAFNERFFNPLAGTYSTGSQTAMAMPLVLGIVEEEYRDLVLGNLVDSIENSNYALTAGDVGFYFLVKALQDGGLGHILYEMNTRDDVPGYGYQLKQGATALTESWSALTGKSNNHLMLGHLMEWFYAGLAGINQTQQSLAYREVLISPQIVGDITSASASFESPYGKILSKWEIKDDVLVMEINIPVNARAKVVFPVKGKYSIVEGDTPLENVEGLTILAMNEKGCSVQIGSGKYMFKIRNP